MAEEGEVNKPSICDESHHVPMALRRPNRFETEKIDDPEEGTLQARRYTELTNLAG